MQIASTTNASPLPVAPAAPGGNGPTGEDSPFGKILSAQKQPASRPEEVRSARTDSQPEAKADSASKGTEPAEAEAAEPEASQAPSAARRGTARNAPRLAVHGRDATVAKPDAHAKPVEADTRGQNTAKDADKKDTQTEPSAAELAAAMNRPVTAPATLPQAAGAGDAAKAASLPGAVALPAGTSAASALPADVAVQGAAARGSQDTAGVDADDSKRDVKFADTAAAIAEASESARRTSNEEQLVGRKDAQERVEQRLDVPSLRELASTSHVTASHSALRVETAAPPVAVTVATPATSPEFNEALGVQVSVLARDGVQHAELHLNPTDMGPISVQIALDGTRAQVDFGADSLATRQIIESGLPELASALRDAGFTLAGGGVSQHSRGQADREGGDRQPGTVSSRRVNGSSDVQAVAARRSTVRTSQGGVDLYA